MKRQLLAAIAVLGMVSAACGSGSGSAGNTTGSTDPTNPTGTAGTTGTTGTAGTTDTTDTTGTTGTAGTAKQLKAMNVAVVKPPATFAFGPLASGSRTFGYQLGSALAPDADNGNLVYSPVSLALVFAMLREGAKGQTAIAIDDVMHFPADQDRSAAFNALAAALRQSRPGITLEVGNGLFFDPSLPIKPAYLNSIQKWYGSGVYQTPFPDPALDDINRYVDHATHGRIPHLLTEMPPGALAALVNTVYLEAAWLSSFEKSETANAPFTAASGQPVTVMMMHQELEADYAHGSGWEAVRLPFSGESLSMEILLPSGDTSALSLLAPAVLQDADRGFSPANVSLSLPRWKLDNTLDLTKTLDAMGMSVLFSGAADLSGISDVQMQVLQAIQQATIDVDEKGVVAAAASAVIVGESAHQPPPTHVRFNANHPFAFVIMDDRTGTPLFEGVVSDPS